MSESIENIIAQQEERDKSAPPRVPFKWYDLPVLAIFLILFAVVFLQFFSRYVLNDSVAWTEEMARYLLVALAFVGAVKCQLIKSHIRLEILGAKSHQIARFLESFSLLASAFFAGFCTWSLWVLISKTSYQKMVSLPFPKYYLYAVIMVALVALTCIAIYQALRSFKGEKQ
ncbi:TRAP transporter small permease [Thalassospira alkalitolerans]|uniref:TRAP transporter small permease n=1 Tax=Thalassospira alkalitolerans TaxID=1293890 RepID=UPI00146EFCAC|nr:TRAP transporter small permease [Thalassospira alkalitolerans]